MSVDKLCPICHKLNKHLDLKETNGWMECIHCGKVIRVVNTPEMVYIPYLGVAH